MSEKTNVYVNPKAPDWLRKFLLQSLAESKEVDADEMQEIIDRNTHGKAFDPESPPR